MKKKIKKHVVPLIVLISGVIFFFIRWSFPERSFDYTGPRAFLDMGFALGLLVLVVILAIGLGQRLLRFFGIRRLFFLEQYLFSLSLGLGVLAYGVVLFGFLGILTWWGMFILMAAATALGWPYNLETVIQFPQDIKRFAIWFREIGIYGKGFAIASGSILLLSILQALRPPTGVDGLIYHLQGPKLYVQAQRMYPTPEFTPGGFPFTVEMLFTLGMVFGSDTFAQLIHLTYGVLLLVAIYIFGRRYLKAEAGGMAAAMLLGMPIFPIWATMPYIDLAWALYEFLGLYLLLLVWDQRDSWGEALAGVLVGFALGSKYLALGGVFVLGLCGLWRRRKFGWKSIFKFAVLFGSVALLVGSPWYLKNWAWYNNPVYPFFRGLMGTGVERSLNLGSRYSFQELLFMPVNLYLHHQRYAGVNGTVEFLSPFFLLVFGYPLVCKNKVMSFLAGFALLRYGFWLLTTPGRMRYLLPAFPALALLAAYVLTRAFSDLPRHRRMKKLALRGLLGGFIAVTLVYSLLFAIDKKPLSVIFGVESKDSFLRRELRDYAAIQFVHSQLPPDARVLMLWDGRAYYCDQRCLPDFIDRWKSLMLSSLDVEKVADQMSAMGVTHVLIDKESLNYKLLYDRTGKNRKMAEFVVNEFLPACTVDAYQDDWATISTFICD
jgi:hypothetical protein